jgi:hypothetical protein
VNLSYVILVELTSIISNKIQRKNQGIVLHRLFRDDEESIAKQDIKLAISSSTNFVFDRLISFKNKKVIKEL